MGMFDSFVGEVPCPHCGESHEFEEQTKAYDCMLDEFHIGDYVEKGNVSYIYDFEWYCQKDKQPYHIGIVFKNGQIIKFVSSLDQDYIEEINIAKLDNIEDGLGKRLLYEKVCREANGIPKERLEYELNPLTEEYKFIAFGVEWEVIKLYRQKEGFLSKDIEYYYEIKSKEHGMRILHTSKRFWHGGMEICTLELCNEYRSLYFDKE